MHTNTYSRRLFSTMLMHLPGAGVSVGWVGASVLLLMGALSLGSCASAEKTPGEPKTIVGKVQVIGNEPFASLALETAGGTMYVLHCTADVEKMLLQHQGKSARIHFREFETVPSGQAIRVIAAEMLSP